MKTIFITILLFFYIFPIKFNFLPQSTRSLFAILGVIWFTMLYMQKRKNIIIIPHYIFNILSLLIFIAIIGAVSIVYNLTSDLHFIKYIGTITLMLFGSYFIIMCIKKFKYQLNFQIISSLIINVVLIQTLIALSMFLVPEIRDALLSIKIPLAFNSEKIEELSEFRIIGFGAEFFTAGIINGFALILIAVQIRIYKFSSKKILFLSLNFLIILVVGMMMARTTMVGALLSFFIMFFPKDLKSIINISKKNALFFLAIIIIPCIIVNILLFLVPSFNTDITPVFEYAFEMFLKYFEKDSFETDSTNALIDAYNIYPTELKTWIIGDGYLAHPSKINSYYMNTDVGYIRLIFYSGFFGTILYFIFQIYIIIVTYKVFDINKKIYLFVVLYLLILNLKGLTDLFFIHILFIMAYLLKNKESINT